MRLDLYVFERYSLKSRTYSTELIQKGKVTVNGKTVTKPSFSVAETDLIIIDEGEKFASQGAFKLDKALKEFSIDISGKVCADFGCSNGGFTDVMLRANACSITAFDVGDCALPQGILENSKVTFVKANVRELPDFKSSFDFIASDLSFISLKLVLPSVYACLKSNGECALLIKPQFEVGRVGLTKNGIVKNAKIRLKAVDDVVASATTLGFKVLGICESPVFYESKNIEHLLYLKKP